MPWIHVVWLAAGLLLGIVHATGLWRTAKHSSAATAVHGLARLLVVGLVLASAAMLGGMLPAATGWSVGFFVRVGMMMNPFRIRQRKAAS